MLDGLRVLEIVGSVAVAPGSEAAAAHATRILADLGADVVKLEPEQGDGARRRPPFVEGVPNVDGSCWWIPLDANKRSATISRGALATFLRGADVVVQGQVMTHYEDVARANPTAVLVTITPYGTTGPLAGAPASDLEITAASGSLWLAGEPGRAPVRSTLPQSPFWMGMYGAMGALVALAARARTGRGQEVDVSGQASLATVHPPAIVHWDVITEAHERLGAALIGRSIVGARFRNLWRCADGYVSFAIQGGPIGRHTGRQLAAWMKEKGALDDVIGAIDWDTFDNRVLTQAQVDRLEASVESFLLTLTKREFFAGVIARNMLGYPASDARDIFADEQLRSREFWQKIRVGEREVTFPGGFALFDGLRPTLRRGPPSLYVPTATLSWAPGGDWRLIAEQRSRATTELRASEASGVSATATLAAPAAAAGALAGLRVVELGWAAAGPFVGKYLANHGAEVIHLESRQALDPFRTTYPPFKGEPAPDRAGMFAFYNDGKRGATLNLRDPRAADLALRLVAKADVVIESFPAGTLARRGLSHEAMRRARPDVVVLSSCNQGQTGPHAQHPGYGSQLTALAGFNELLGEPDRSPVILYGPYIDYIAVGYGVIAILAALERRRRTGQGCLIDLSQYEAGLQFMAPALLELAANGTVPTRAGNRDPQARPHGVYRCADGDDAWVALSVWSADEWSSFREAVAHPEWSRDDPRLDALVEGWTRERTRDEVTATLRRVGLRVQPVLTIPELREDEQLRHRAFWRSVPHPVLESITVMAPPFILSDTPAVLERAGPTLGQDNGYVFRELLGLDESEYRALEAEGVFA